MQFWSTENTLKLRSNKTMKLVIAGAGTYGSVYKYYIEEQSKHTVIGFADDDESKIGQKVNGVEVICKTRDFEKIRSLGVEGVIAPIGDNRIRLNLLIDYISQGFQTPSFIHNSVVIPRELKIGRGVYILPGSIIMPFVEIHDFVMISIGVKVAHHTILGEASFLSTGVNIGAMIDFGKCAFAGIGSTISTGVKRIGNYAIIGAGSVIIRDVEDHAVIVGNPGRVIRYTQ